jgi:phosphinothricin acetyltransferase
MGLQIRAMQPGDWPEVRQIYADGIATQNATFETVVPEWDRWDAAHRKDCRIVAQEGNAVLGWAALSPVSSRRVYAGVAEISVYVGKIARGRGVGKLLLQSLIDESEAVGIWTLQAGIFPENAASIALHKSCEFREVGVRKRIGQLAGTWRDVILLERRSERAGV